MTPRIRKLALTAHLTTSVGWIGSVATFLVLAFAGLKSENAQVVRAAYLSMELTTWGIIVPLAIASLLTGLVQSVGTEWGLFKHYWIIAKLVIALLATVILLVHTGPIGRVAEVAAQTTLGSTDLSQLRVQLIADAVGAIIALLVATFLSVYKPRGLTPYGRRDLVAANATNRAPDWVRIARIVAMILVALFVVAHLAGRGMHGH